jgi:hypothetical protein
VDMFVFYHLASCSRCFVKQLESKQQNELDESGRYLRWTEKIPDG